MIELCRAALGWRPEDPNERFFAWKHDENPFGPSPAWIAEARRTGRSPACGCSCAGSSRPGGAPMRGGARGRHRDPPGHAGPWHLHPPDPRRPRRTCRTTASTSCSTRPTTRADPGYLKMGWQVVGRVPVGAVRIGGPRSATAAVRASRLRRSGASRPTVGLSAVARRCRITDGVERLLGGAATDDRLLRTDAAVGLPPVAVPLRRRSTTGRSRSGTGPRTAS